MHGMNWEEVDPMGDEFGVYATGEDKNIENQANKEKQWLTPRPSQWWILHDSAVLCACHGDVNTRCL